MAQFIPWQGCISASMYVHHLMGATPALDWGPYTTWRYKIDDVYQEGWVPGDDPVMTKCD